jgi:hypothetical protein
MLEYRKLMIKRVVNHIKTNENMSKRNKSECMIKRLFKKKNFEFAMKNLMQKIQIKFIRRRTIPLIYSLKDCLY